MFHCYTSATLWPAAFNRRFMIACPIRGVSNAICEISALAKPNILIPLSANASRGDQILNARSFERQGYSKVLEEESVNAQTLQSAIREVYENRQTYINAMKKSSHTDSIGRILCLIQECERK